MVERIAAYILYVALVLAVIWGGATLVGYAVDYHFHATFLAPWQRALATYTSTGNPWPEFRNNHVAYMTELTARVSRRTGFEPVARGRGAFMYRLSRPGEADEHVLVLGLRARMVVYGLSMETARRLDRFADGTPDLNAGTFRGRPGTAGGSVVVTWDY